MKCTLSFPGSIMILFLSSFLAAAQGTNDELYSGVSNAEPAHANFSLGDDNSSPLKLNIVEESEMNYQSAFHFEPEWTGKQVFASFTGIHVPFHLKINGFKYGMGDGKRNPLEFNITPFLIQGVNLIELDVDSAVDRIPDQAFKYSTLLIRDPVHIRDLEVSTYFQTETPQCLVRIHLFIQGYLQEQNRGRNLTLNILDPEGVTINTHEQTLNFPLAFRQEVEFTFDQNIENPMLWSPGHPHLYMLQITMIEEGKTEGESISSYFGIRNITLVDSVLLINEDTIVPIIADQAVVNEIENQSDDALLYLFKKRGANGIVTSHHLSPRVLDLFDRKGIAVLKKQEERDSKRDRPDLNRPSLIWIE